MKSGLYRSIVDPPRGADLDRLDLAPDRLLGDAQTCAHELHSAGPAHEKIRRLGGHVLPHCR